jgi:hypothetical protein
MGRVQVTNDTSPMFVPNHLPNILNWLGFIVPGIEIHFCLGNQDKVTKMAILALFRLFAFKNLDIIKQRGH